MQPRQPDVRCNINMQGGTFKFNCLGIVVILAFLVPNDKDNATEWNFRSAPVAASSIGVSRKHELMSCMATH